MKDKELAWRESLTCTDNKGNEEERVDEKRIKRDKHRQRVS